MYNYYQSSLIATCMHVHCIENYRPLVVDATQSRLKGLLMKAKRYIIPFDKRKLVVYGNDGYHNHALFHGVRFSFVSSLPWCCGCHGDAALPGIQIANSYSNNNDLPWSVCQDT